jgi:hypothetical protein
MTDYVDLVAELGCLPLKDIREWLIELEWMLDPETAVTLLGEPVAYGGVPATVQDAGLFVLAYITGAERNRKRAGS